MQPLRASSRIFSSSRSRLPGQGVSFLPFPTASISQCRNASSQRSFLPRLAQGSIWQSIVPKSLRDRWNRTDKSGKKKPINPASYFIWIYLLIGSQSIRIMGIQTDFDEHMRKADLKLNKLRQVVQKLQKGEAVDVERALGTGDEIQEQEWEDALRELVEEDRVWQNNKKKAREENERLAREEQDANPLNRAVIVEQEAAVEIAPSPTTPHCSPGFY